MVTVVVDTVVMLVVLESGAVLVVIVVPVVEGRHSEHPLHVAHWHRVVQGCVCCELRQFKLHCDDTPACVVVVINIPPTGVVVVTVSEVAVVLVSVVKKYAGNDVVLGTGVVAVVTMGRTTGGGCVGSTTPLQSEQVAQDAQLHLMYQGWPFPKQYCRHSLGCWTGGSVGCAVVLVAVVTVLVTVMVVAVVVVLVHIATSCSVRSEDAVGDEQTSALQILAVIANMPRTRRPTSKKQKGGVVPWHSNIHAQSPPSMPAAVAAAPPTPAAS